MIESNVDNRESLKKALQMAKVVINCTGPNSVLSAPIVEASIESGTHYLDISAEMFVSVIYLLGTNHRATRTSYRSTNATDG